MWKNKFLGALALPAVVIISYLGYVTYQSSNIYIENQSQSETYYDFHFPLNEKYKGFALESHDYIHIATPEPKFLYLSNGHETIAVACEGEGNYTKALIRSELSESICTKHDNVVTKLMSDIKLFPRILGALRFY